MKVSFWASRHARSILFLLVALVAGGVLGGLSLPVSLFPKVNFPRVRVDIEAGEQPAERMVVEITRPVEEELRSIPGVRGVQSVTSRGSAQVLLTFDWGDNITQDMLAAEAAVNKLIATLPPGTTFGVRRMDPSFFPVISYSMTSDSRPLSELYDIAEYQLRPILSTTTGVAKVDVNGGAVEEFRVIPDPARLAHYGLAVSDVANALSTANVLSAVGRVEDRSKLFLVVADKQLKTVADISATVVHGGSGGVVRVADVAAVARLPAPNFTRATADGRSAVLFDVYQQPGGNTVQIAAGVRAALDEERKRLPGDVKIANWYDQSELIVASAASVRDAVLIGVALAALVLLLFLRDFRITLIAALTVPVVLAVTALLLFLLGESFNIMTLGGMAAAVGLIIDDAIVISEHIVRRVRDGKTPAGEAPARVLDAANEFTRPLAGSSLSTIIIHIPPAFMIGVAGAFFASLSLAMASSLVISFFVAWLAIPIIASRWLGGRRAAHAPPSAHATQTAPAAQPADNAATAHRGFYPRLMRFILPRPWVVLPVAALILIAGYLLYGRLPSGFMPSVDEGGFTLDYRAAPGASLAETDRLCRQVEAILRQTPEVQTYSRRTGYNFGSGEISESNTGDFFIRLKPLPRRPIGEVRDELEKRVARQVPGLDIETAQLMEDLIGDLTGRPQPVVVNLYSDNPAQLNELAAKVTDGLGKIPDVKEVRSGIIPAGDALNVEVDPVAAAIEGVDPQAFSKLLSDALQGTVATQIPSGPRLINLRVWLPSDTRRSIAEIGRLLLRAPDGHLFPVSRVATLALVTGQPEITREDLKRMAPVTARSDRDLGSTIADVRKLLDQPGYLPPGVRYTLGGLYQQQQLAFAGLLRVILAAAALVFLLLLFMYERLRVAVAILFTTGLAIAIVFIGLWLTGTELNISSIMGMVMIVGNVTEVAIFYLSEFVQTHGPSRQDRLIVAGVHRSRAILMTTLAAILALLPLALGIGQGSGMLQPLAISIIAGLAAQLPLVLLILPALLTLLGVRIEPPVVGPGAEVAE